MYIKLFIFTVKILGTYNCSIKESKTYGIVPRGLYATFKKDYRSGLQANVDNDNITQFYYLYWDTMLVLIYVFFTSQLCE